MFSGFNRPAQSGAEKLQFVLPESSGRFIPPHFAFSSVLPVFEDRLKATLPKPIFHQAFIGDSFSLIYSPFFIKDKVYDGLLNQPVSSEPPEDLDAWLSSAKTALEKYPIRSGPVPKLRLGLGRSSNSMIFTCKNCHSVCADGQKWIKKMKFAFIYEPGDNIIYLPFWRNYGRYRGNPAPIFADWSSLPICQSLSKHWKDIHSAFGFRGSKSARRPLSVFPEYHPWEPNEKLIRELPNASVHPVTLPVEEAVQS
jgi:hypothetical protein